MKPVFNIRPGSRRPLGATVYPDGVNFSLASKDATRAELLLYEAFDSIEPVQVIELDPANHRTFIFWHVFVDQLGPGVHSVEGSRPDERDLRGFDPSIPG